MKNELTFTVLFFLSVIGSHTEGAINIEYERAQSWLARAMQNSGAADLLRAYRSVS